MNVKEDLKEDCLIDIEKELSILNQEYSINIDSSETPLFDQLRPLEGIEKIIGQDGPLEQFLEHIEGGENIILVGNNYKNQLKFIEETFSAINSCLKLPKKELLRRKKEFTKQRLENSKNKNSFNLSLEERLIDVALSKKNVFQVDQVILSDFKDNEPYKNITLPAGYGEKLKDDINNFTNFIKKDHLGIIKGDNFLTDLQYKITQKYNHQVKKLNFKSFAHSYNYFLDIEKLGTKNFSPEKNVSLSFDKKELPNKKRINQNDETLKELNKNKSKQLKKNRSLGAIILKEMSNEYKEYKEQKEEQQGQIHVRKINTYLSHLDKIITKWKDKPFFEDQKKLIAILRDMYQKISLEGIEINSENNLPYIDYYEVKIIENKKGVKDLPIVMTYDANDDNDFFKANNGILVVKNGTKMLEDEDLVYNLDELIETKGLVFEKLINKEGVYDNLSKLKANFSMVLCIDKESEKLLGKSDIHNNGDEEDQSEVLSFNSFKGKFKRVYLQEFMENSLENRIKIARFVKTTLDELNKTSKEKRQEPFPSIDNEGLVSLVQYAAIESLNLENFRDGFLNTNLNYLESIIKGTSLLARSSGIKKISRKHLGEYLMKERENLSISQKLFVGYFKQDNIVSLKDKKIGYCLGCSAEKRNEHYYGSIQRAEATLTQDQHEPKQIEIDSDLVDNSARKGWEVVKEVLRKKFYTSNIPLRVSSPQEIEESSGNSFSAAMLASCISALSRIPLHQGIIVTGGIYSSEGDIGTVSYTYSKKSGAYQHVKSLGFNHNQGGIIPSANLKEFVLAAQFDQELFTAVKEGKFNIYQVNNINQMMEILSDHKAEEHYKKAQETIEQIKSLNYNRNSLKTHEL